MEKNHVASRCIPKARPVGAAPRRVCVRHDRGSGLRLVATPTVPVASFYPSGPVMGWGRQVLVAVQPADYTSSGNFQPLTGVCVERPGIVGGIEEAFNHDSILPPRFNGIMERWLTTPRSAARDDPRFAMSPPRRPLSRPSARGALPKPPRRRGTCPCEPCTVGWPRAARTPKAVERRRHFRSFCRPIKRPRETSSAIVCGELSAPARRNGRHWPGF